MSTHDHEHGREPMHTGMVAPKGHWWVPAHKSEKVWFAIAFAWCMVLFAMMPLWHWKGGQNPSGIRRRVDPAAFVERVERVRRPITRSARLDGMPIVEPPPGSDVYLLGRMWTWYPDAEAAEGRRVHAAPLVHRREPRILPVSGQHQLPGRARLRLRPAHHADRGRRLPHHLQRVLRHRSPHDGRARSIVDGRSSR